MTVFRIHIRPKGGLASSKVSFAYCVKKSVLGVGWQTKSNNNCDNLEEYVRQAKDIYKDKELLQVKYIEKHIKKDDLLWTRDEKGNYYLGKVISGWEYLSNQEARQADIVNIVRCELQKVPSIDDVPGKVIACFRPSRTIQAIRDRTASDYSHFLWNKIVNKEYYTLSNGQFKNVFSFLNSEETEDVIFIYLQENGWVVIPNSRKADTMGYEFYLINRKSKEKSIVQVKTGNTTLTPSNWENKKEKVFLFQANNKYKGESSSSNVVCISPRTIESFMVDNRDLLPSNISHWLDVANNEKKV